MHLGCSIAMFGDFSNEGNFTNNLGTLHVVGSEPQTFNGSNIIHSTNFKIEKSDNALQLNNVLQIAGLLTFEEGKILTNRIDMDTKFVEFLDGASYIRQNDQSHVDGAVRKTGNEPFVFPIGHNSILRTVRISAPALVSDHFTAYYAESDPDALYSSSSLDIGLYHISACEHWMLNRTGGNSDVAVTLSWALNSCGVNDLCDLRVSRWDGAQWLSEGNGGVTGTVVAGTLVSGENCGAPESATSFGPFTLGSFSGNNPLPISLISFNAVVCESSVCLSWQTASETNNDFFTVEKSRDGLIWEGLVNINGAGNSNTTLYYSTIDGSPFSGFSYYRLKQTDFDGEFEYSQIESFYLNATHNQRLNIYPNPSRELIAIKGLRSDDRFLKIYNSMGQLVRSIAPISHSSESDLQLDISLIAPGIYHIKTNSNQGSFIKQ